MSAGYRTIDLFAGPGGWDLAATELGLHPPLSATVVVAVADPYADSFLPPLHHYPEELHAPIESRILQEAEE